MRANDLISSRHEEEGGDASEEAGVPAGAGTEHTSPLHPTLLLPLSRRHNSRRDRFLEKLTADLDEKSLSLFSPAYFTFGRSICMMQGIFRPVIVRINHYGQQTGRSLSLFPNKEKGERAQGSQNRETFYRQGRGDTHSGIDMSSNSRLQAEENISICDSVLDLDLAEDGVRR